VYEKGEKKMKAKHCLTLMIIAAIATSLALMSVPVMAADGDVTIDLTMYYFSTSGIIPGQDPDTYFAVEVYLDATALPNKAPTGLMGYGLKVTVDPTVLTPVGAVGGSAGYLLYDWSYATYPPLFPGGPIIHKPQFLFDLGTDFVSVTEMFLDLPEGEGLGGTAGKACSLWFQSHSKTAYTEITVEPFPASGYQQVLDLLKFAVVGIDGHYNKPTDSMLLEQYTGSTWPPGDPSGTDWHELDPDLCKQWTVDEWTDNGDGKLSPSDQLIMTRASPVETFEFHVEWVSPGPAAGDGTADLLVTLKPGVPEFPLGSVAPIALIAAVAYIWWVTRRKRQEAV
jgi:hypothetical protein